MTDLEAKIITMEEIEKIKILKSNYCFLVDEIVAGDNKKIEEFMGKFTDDAWIDFTEFGKHEGKGAISAFYSDIVAQVLSYSAHMVSNPIIEVNGNTATGRWYFEVPCTIRVANKPAWIQGKYYEQYRKIGGEWKWSSITTRFDFFSPIEEGWVKARMPSI